MKRFKFGLVSVAIVWAVAIAIVWAVLTMQPAQKPKEHRSHVGRLREITAELASAGYVTS
jgi:hypothetical protein